MVYKYAIISLILIVMLTGCLGGPGSGQGDNAGNQEVNLLDKVPNQANFVGAADGDVLTDDNTREIANTLSVEEEGTYDQMLSQGGLEGVNITEMDRAVFYGVQQSDSENGGLIVYSEDWSQSDLSDALSEGYTMESTTTYSEVKVEEYSGKSNEPLYFAALGDNMYTFASSMAETERMVDVHQGNAEALSGQLRQTISNMDDKYVRFAASSTEFEQGTGQYNFETVTGSFDYQNNNMIVEAEMDLSSEQNATQLNQTISFLTTTTQQNELSNNLNINREGTEVTIKFEDSVDNITKAIEESKNQTPRGVGEPQRESRNQTQSPNRLPP